MQTYPLPQTAPISDMRQRQDDILTMTKGGPVVLLSRSQPAAVLLSPTMWDEIADELKRLHHLEICDWVSKELAEDPSTRITLTGDELVELHRG
ncbi:MAG: hypothetical protein KDE46_00975 [Caldilineaceae bacterium]|nr:hypothetical protein [Caldilineaceae bacterium]